MSLKVTDNWDNTQSDFHHFRFEDSAWGVLRKFTIIALMVFLTSPGLQKVYLSSSYPKMSSSKS